MQGPFLNLRQQAIPERLGGPRIGKAGTWLHTMGLLHSMGFLAEVRFLDGVGPMHQGA
jgi:hypothetical protein